MGCRKAGNIAKNQLIDGKGIMIPQIQNSDPDLTFCLKLIFSALTVVSRASVFCKDQQLIGFMPC